MWEGQGVLEKMEEKETKMNVSINLISSPIVTIASNAGKEMYIQYVQQSTCSNSQTHKHARTHAHTHARTHAHAHTHTPIGSMVSFSLESAMLLNT